MPTHTPGPWHAGKFYPKKINHYVATSSGDVVCRLNGSLIEVFDARVEANARLIAAAPDLLAALIAAVEYAPLIPAPLGSPLTEHVDVWPDWVIAGRNAIAKAIGE